MEGAAVKPALGQPAEIVHDTKNQNTQTDEETGGAAEALHQVFESAGDLFGSQLVNSGVDLPIDIKNGVGGFKADFHPGVGGFQCLAALYGEDNVDFIPGKHPSAHDKPVQPGQHGDAADIGGNEKVEKTDVLIAVHPFLTEAFVCSGYVKILFIENAGGTSVPEKIGDEFTDGRKGAEKPSVFPVTGSMFV